MLDINTLIKQEDSNRKLNLLKQIKLSIESLMFDTTTNTNRSSCHSLGIITILSRHVLAILEDNIDTTNDNMSNSPGTGANNSRSITQSSIEVTSLLQNNEIDDALWCFILFTFKSDNNNNNNQLIAKKEFELIYTQIKLVKEQELADNITNNNDFNFAFNWILACLRQNLLFNQMSYLLADSNLIEKFYKPLAFLQDRLFVNDFLNLIKAYETRDYNILKKIKRNFYTTTINNNDNNNKNIRSLTTATTTTTTNSTATSSSSSSHASSINLQNHFNEIPLILSSDNNNNKSLIELAINEINLTSKLKNTHRRMHSIPNIQINEAKRNRLLMTESFNSNVVMNTNNNLNVSDSIDQNESFYKSESIASSPPPPLTKIIENQLSTSNLLLNSQIENNLQPNSEENSNDKIIIDYNDSNDIYYKTTVFDFIHSQQINCDCNQVDKENSHFIIADIAMTAFELIKTQDLNDLNQFDIDNENNNNNVKLRKNYNNFLTINTNINNINAKKNRIKSTEIKIDNKLKNKSRDTNSLQFVGSFNSSISPITNGGIFSSDDYASSIEKEVFFTSGCGSPNLDALSSSSLMSTTKQDNAHKKRHKKSLSLVNSNINTSNSDLLNFETKHIFKSLSSNNISDIPQNQKSNDLETWYLRNNQVEEEVEEEPAASTIAAAATTTVSTIKPTINIISPNASFNTKTNIHNNISSLISSPSPSPLVHNSSSATLNSEIQSNRTRRFSWEEIINLDTAENIANRLIEKLIENENQRKFSNKNTINYGKLAQVPSLKQFEIFIQLLECLVYMQTYYEMRNSGDLHKYIQLLALNNSKQSANLSAASIYQLRHTDKQPTSSKTNSLLNSILKSFEKSIKSKTTIISKIKIAATTAVSINQFNLDQQKVKYVNHNSNSMRVLDQEDQQELDIELKRVSLNQLENLSLSSKTTSQVNELNGDNLLDKSITSLTSTTSKTNSNRNSSYKTLNPRILGDESWAPVRDQLIVHYTPKQKRIDQMQQQNFRCADCGIQVRKDKMKSFNYCEYYCKYFCRCCHIGNQSYIPAYIVNSLDFKTKYEVSKKAKNFLETIYNQPVINLESLNSSLFERTNIFSKFKKVRCKLNNCRHYINSCRFAIDLKNLLTNQFDDFIINDQMAYSIEILFKIKQTNYFEVFKKIVNDCIEHIKKCELCSQQGYICGICNNNELLYPFELDKVQKCENCLTCCHKNCLKKPELCPRCKRKQNRMQTASSGTLNITNK